MCMNCVATAAPLVAVGLTMTRRKVWWAAVRSMLGRSQPTPPRSTSTTT